MSENVRKIPKKSEKVRKCPKKSEKVRKCPKKSEKVRKSPKDYNLFSIAMQYKILIFLKNSRNFKHFYFCNYTKIYKSLEVTSKN